MTLPVEKHFHERSAELQIPPLRYASVGMTKLEVALPLGTCDLGWEQPIHCAPELECRKRVREKGKKVNGERNDWGIGFTIAVLVKKSLDFLPGLPGFFRGEGLRQNSSGTTRTS